MDDKPTRQPPDREDRRWSQDTAVDDVFMDLKLDEGDLSSSDDEARILNDSGGSSFLFSSLESRDPFQRNQAPTSASGAEADADLTEDDLDLKDSGLPSGFERLPSAMRPPVAAVVAAQEKRRGHTRSASTGGNYAFSTYHRPNLFSATLPTPLDEKEEKLVRESRWFVNDDHVPMPPSALKKSSLPNTASGHRRVFSHGQISFVSPPPDGSGNAQAMTSEVAKGHRRTGSKTDFILPPGHETRERKRSIHRSGSKRLPDQPGPGFESTEGVPSAPPSARHRRLHSRSDSLGFSFRGHSRQASRTESIYTLRPMSVGSPPYRSKLFFWNRGDKVLNDDDDAERIVRNRIVVPNHTIPENVPSDKHPNHAYCDNYVSTTKYTIFNFLFKNLFEQFHRFANLYFLFIVLLNWVPAINAFGKEISMLPVIFVLGVTAIKDIFEDRRRYKSDKRVNNSTCRVYNSSHGRYCKTLWKDIRVGDIVHLSCNEKIPADILVLRSSDEHGLCYIDTQNLDGEQNLKQREVPRGFVERQSTFKPQDFKSTLECDLPTTKIYRFHGTILHPWGEKVSVGKDNLLVRECVLKNTDFVEGLVVYAGHESKAMLNNGGPRYKRSKLERQMNVEIIWCVVTLLFLCLIGAIGSGVWLNGLILSNSDFVPPFLCTLVFPSPSFEGFLTFWTFIIIFQVIIPLSLYVTIELTKLAQIHLIHQDSQMFDEATNKRVECRALNIPEELGQIQYIFCDKTGTLTENNMVFKRCTIGGIDYGHNTFTTRFNAATPRASGTSVSTTATSLSSISNQVFVPSTGRAVIPVNPALSEKLLSLDLRTLIEGKDSKSRSYPQAAQTQDFFLLLAICNTVIVAKYPHRDQMNASGLVLSGMGDDKKRSDPSQDQDGSFIRERAVTFSAIGEEETNNVGTSLTPPLSLISSSTTTTVTSNTILSGPLQPDQSLTPPKRPNKFLGLFPPAKPLSPIASSPDVSPSVESASPAPARSKHLHLPHILSKLVPSVSLTSLVRGLHHNSSRTATPTPFELQPIYEAESPDELALVDAACAYNCKLLRRSPNHAVVSLPGEGMVEFEVLHVLPFDSVRKRMSLIVRHPVTRERILFCKGADSAIFPRIEIPESPEAEEVFEKTQLHLDNYAKQGLRVLVMAKRPLSEDEYQEWAAKHKEAENSLQRRERLLFESYNRMEIKLSLLGATGIEDKLQEGVPETIAHLREAGIVVWVLTGDKQETAINIAYSCKLFSHDMEIIKLNARSRDAVDNTIKCYLESIEKEIPTDMKQLRSDESFRKQQRASLLKRKKRALVVDGKTLVYILDKRANLQESFLRLTSHCSSVLGCRTTPLQKAYIVRIVKEELGMHTLAIGDGANDVSMIQTADVGVGISGMEGMQAVMASDFSIARFKYLERLLLVHGHWNYDRLARMVLYFFYKNAAFVFVCFWYQMYCGFSGTVMIDQMYLMLYNFLFTSLPPMAIGIYDQDAPDVLLSAQPTLYSQGRLGLVYQKYSFWINMSDALYQSLVVFFISTATYRDSNVDIWEFGTVICTTCLAAMLSHLSIETKSWTIIHWSSILLSVFLYFLFALIYNGFCITCFGLQNPFWVVQHSMGTAEFWLIAFLSCVLAILPRLCLRAFINTIHPGEVTKAMTARHKAEKSSSRASGGDTRNSWSRATSQTSVLRPQGSSQFRNSTEMSTIVH